MCFVSCEIFDSSFSNDSSFSTSVGGAAVLPGGAAGLPRLPAVPFPLAAAAGRPARAGGLQRQPQPPHCPPPLH